MAFPSTTYSAGGEPLSFSMLERAFDSLREKQSQRADEEERRIKEFSAYAKARYAAFLGVETLSADQEKELWDGMSRVYWKRLVETTDILESYGLE